jgi:hypothetical protein
MKHADSHTLIMRSFYAIHEFIYPLFIVYLTIPSPAQISGSCSSSYYDKQIKGKKGKFVPVLN